MRCFPHAVCPPYVWLVCMFNVFVGFTVFWAYTVEQKKFNDLILFLYYFLVERKNLAY